MKGKAASMRFLFLTIALFVFLMLPVYAAESVSDPASSGAVGADVADPSEEAASPDEAVLFSDADWEYKLVNGSYVISGYHGNDAKVTVPTSAIIEGRTYQIRAIGSSVFAGNQDLEEVILPEGITSIGTSAFKNCMRLSSVEINGDLSDCHPNSIHDETSSDYLRSSNVSVFYNAGANAGHLKVTFTDTVTRIPDYLFAAYADDTDGRYAHVTEVVIGDNVKEIGQYAFYHCYDLKTLELGDKVDTIGNYAFRGNNVMKTLTLDKGLVSVGDFAFADYSNLTDLKLNDGLQTIGKSAFRGTGALESVTLPRSVTEVGPYSFEYSRALRSVEIRGESGDVTALRDGAFRQCPLLSSVTVYGDLANCNPNSIHDETSSDYLRSSNVSVFYNSGSNANGFTVTFETSSRIPDYLFAAYSDLSDKHYAHVTKVVIGDTVKEIGQYAFYHCYDMETLELGDNVDTIGNYAFLGNNVMKTLTLDKGLVSVGDFAFADYTGLTELKLNDGLRAIGESAFRGMTVLESVTLPRSVTEVGAYAFESCTALRSVVIQGKPDDTTALRDGAFRQCPLLSSITVYGNLANCNPDSIHDETSSAKYRSSNVSVFYNSGSKAGGFTVTFETSSVIPEYLFASYPDRSDTHYVHITEVVIGNNVKEIGQYAFYHCYDLQKVRFLGTEGMWEKVIVSKGNESLTDLDIRFDMAPPYRIGELTAEATTGEALNAIPTERFIVTLPITNLAAQNPTTVILAAYSAEGQYKGLLYVGVKDCPVDTTLYLTLPVDNSAGDISILKAFAIDSFSSMKPLSNISEFKS